MARRSLMMRGAFAMMSCGNMMLCTAFVRMPSISDWKSTDLRHDFIVLATPLGATDAVLKDLALRRPPGVIFDVGSLKSPLRAGLLALKSHGCKVTSVHPMFGPDTQEKIVSREAFATIVAYLD